MIADGKILDALSHLNHFTCRFVSETIGVGRGRVPLMTERSEWHKPAARIRTNTSPCPGGSRSRFR